FSYYAVAIGLGESTVNEYFEKEYRRDMSFEDIVKLTLKALFKSRIKGGEEKAEKLIKEFHELVEVGYVLTDERVFNKMDPKTIKSFVSEIEADLLK
ncbi:MAG: proteasome subunit alpha, partial [Desulfurococcales archaeon]|nr:proteasome subunit alpha [Desulfurococcales archaeon]